MTNLTLTIDETQLRKARIVALEQGTSVNVLVREFIANMTAEAAQKKTNWPSWKPSSPTDVSLLLRPS